MVSLDDFIATPEKEIEPDNTGCIDKTDFFTAIQKVEKIKPATGRDGAIWHIYMKVLDVEGVIMLSNSDLMAGKNKFEDLFKSRFKFFLPFEITRKAKKGETAPWKKFQLYIEQICEEIDPTESMEWAECDMLLESVAGLTWIDDPDKWANKTMYRNVLLRKDHEGITYYLLKSEDLAKIAKDLKLSTSIERIGTVMNQRGYKRAKNPTIKIMGATKNPWWFIASCLIEHGFLVYPQYGGSATDFEGDY